MMVAKIKIGTIGKRTIYPKAISDCHKTPVDLKVAYWMIMTREIPKTLKKALIAIVAHSGKFLAR